MSEFMDYELTISSGRHRHETTHEREIRQLKAEHQAEIAALKKEHRLIAQQLREEIKLRKRAGAGMNAMFRQVNWRDLKKEILALDFYECTACDAPASTVIYLTKPSAGGAPHISNLTASCERCMLLCKAEKTFATAEDRRAFVQAHIAEYGNE